MIPLFAYLEDSEGNWTQVSQQKVKNRAVEVCHSSWQTPMTVIELGETRV